MSEVALYRKYRPGSFKDVLGQDQVVGVLEGAIKMGNVAHAYIFAGTRGTGKTTIARILAREVGSSENDISEIDAASNRGIDDIRALRESVRTLPFDSKYKVYIIDEAHMLTKEAFNALLKTLEEPPKHVIFILATTELNKLPETIVSRCQTFTFKKPTDIVLKDLALAVAKKEGMKITPAGAELIAMLGDGSFRDTLGIIQKVASISGDKTIDEAEIQKVTGAPSRTLVNDFLQSLVRKDAAGGLMAIRRTGEQNFDLNAYLKLIITKIRFALILRYAPAMAGDLEISVNDRKFLEELIKKDQGMITSRTLAILLEALDKIGGAFIKELPLELALIRILGEKTDDGGQK